MKLTKSKIMEMIKEELELYEAPRREGPPGQGPQDRYMTPKDRLKTRDMGNLSFPQDDQDDPGDYYSGESNRGYNNLLEELNYMLVDLATKVIDEYIHHPNFGLEEARKEVSDVLQAAVDLFLEERPDGQDLPTILDEKF